MLSPIDTLPGILTVANRPLSYGSYGAFQAQLIDSIAHYLNPPADDLLAPTSLSGEAPASGSSRATPARADATTVAPTSDALTQIGTASILAAINAATTLAQSISARSLTANTVSSETTASATTTEQAGTETSAGGATASAAPPTATASTATTGNGTAIAASTAAPAASAAPAAALTDAARSLLLNLPVNPLRQALSNVAENPAYAAIAGSLHLNVAAYRPAQILVPALPDTPEPPHGVVVGMEVDTEGNSEEATTYYRPRRGSRAHGLKA